jgi:hypothetical protein
MRKHSKAREKTAEVVALYRDGLKAKPIALRLAISPRIVREILIEQGVYAPNNPGNGEESKPARLRNLHSAMMEVLRKASKREAQKETVGDLHAAMVRVVKRCNKPEPMTTAQRFRHRYRTDPTFRMYQLIRRRLRKLLGNEAGVSSRMIALLGCSRVEFKRYISSKFKQGMGWHNNGTGKGKWHLDHIQPCASFDQTNPEHQRICWHFTNYQPMWSKANMRKRDTMSQSERQMSLLC